MAWSQHDQICISTGKQFNLSLDIKHLTEAIEHLVVGKVSNFCENLPSRTCPRGLATVIKKKLHHIEGQRAINRSPSRPDSSGKGRIGLWEAWLK